MRKFLGICLIIACSCFATTAICYADSAEILPKGVTRIDVQTDLFFTIEERFDSDGDEVPLANSFNNIPIGLLLGNPAIPGQTSVFFELEHQELEVLLSYGATDKLSIGVNIPYYWTDNDVTADIVGNPFITIGDLQNLLQMLGYKPLQDWSNESIADIEMGGRYQYFKSDNWRLAFTGAVRLPTGDEDDPDNLADFSHGDGAVAFLLHSNNDYMGIKNLILNFTLRYELTLPHDSFFRVPGPGELITANKEYLERDPGDVLEIELQGTYRFDNGFGFSLLYEFGKKFEDSYSGGSGGPFNVLEDNSDVESHIFKTYISYSTVQKFIDKEFPVPFEACLGYRNRFAGENNLKSEYISFWITSYF